MDSVWFSSSAFCGACIASCERCEFYAKRKFRSQEFEQSRIQERCNAEIARDRWLFSNSWLLEFFLMGRSKVSGNSRTLGSLKQKHQWGTEQADDYQRPKLIQVGQE